MRITLSSPRTGVAFFPGLAAPRTLDLGDLPAPLAQEIEACVAQLAKEHPTDAATGLGAPADGIFHHVVVERAGAPALELRGPQSGTMGRLVRAFHAALRQSPS